MRAVLSYSRKGYTEAVLREDTESFLRCPENALRHFGGTPLLLNVDNLKAAWIRTLGSFATPCTAKVRPSQPIAHRPTPLWLCSRRLGISYPRKSEKVS